MGTTTIEYTVQAGDILGTTDATEYDAYASAKAYAAALEGELAAAYPDATIDVRVARTSGGGREARVIVVDDDGTPGDEYPIEQGVREVANRLWERMDSWLVRAEA